MPRFTEDELNALCETTGATEEVRRRLHLLWVECDLTYGAAGRVLEVKPEALKQMVYRLRRRARAAQEQEKMDAPADPDDRPVTDRDLLKLQKNSQGKPDHGPLTAVSKYNGMPEEVRIRGEYPDTWELREDESWRTDYQEGVEVLGRSLGYAGKKRASGKT
jgi:hypothetical protein